MVIHTYYKIYDEKVRKDEREHYDCYAGYYAGYRSMFVRASIICADATLARQQLKSLKLQLMYIAALCNACDDWLDRPGGRHGH